MLLNGEHGIDEFLHRLGPVFHLILADPFGGGRHALDHIAVRIAEAGIVFEEIAVGQHVGDDQFVLNE